MALRDGPLRHWPLKLAALALSLLLWAVMASREVTTQLVAVRLDLDFGDTLALVEPPPAVTALVRGPGHEIIKLYRSPPVLRAAVPSSALRRPYRLRLSAEQLAIPASANVTVEAVEPREVYVSLARSGPRP